jgi:hypothetical protein
MDTNKTKRPFHALTYIRLQTTHMNGAYMTKTTTQSAQLDQEGPPDPHQISEDANITDISPSSEINRRVVQKLEFAWPYFDPLRQQNPNSGGGGDSKHHPQPQHNSSPIQQAISRR